MKRYLMMLSLCLLLVQGCSDRKDAESYPLFWTWLDYRPGMDFEGVCQTMNEVGIDAVMLNAK